MMSTWSSTIFSIWSSLVSLLFLAIKHLWSSTLEVEDLENTYAYLDCLLECLLPLTAFILWKPVRPVLETGWTTFSTWSPDLLFLSCWSMGEVTRGSMCDLEVEHSSKDTLSTDPC
jgi:hypothetical protein